MSTSPFPKIPPRVLIEGDGQGASAYAGTLELIAAGALPEGSTVAYEGGELVSTAAAFPASLKVRIPGAEDGSVQRVTLATFSDACPATLPEVEVVNASGGRQWCVEFRGNTLRAKVPFDAVMIFR